MRLLEITRRNGLPVLEFATAVGPRSKQAFGANCRDILRAIREAGRDELYAMHGEGWRAHEQRAPDGFCGVSATQNEQQMLEQAERMLSQ